MMKEYLTKNELIELVRNSDDSSKFAVEKIEDYYGNGCSYIVKVEIVNKAVSTYNERW